MKDRSSATRTFAGRRVGSAAFAQLVHDRSLRLAAGLAVAVAIPVALLFYFQFRSIADLGQSSALVLRQLSQDTADGLTKDIEEQLKAPYLEVLLRITQAHTEPLDAPFIQQAFDASLNATAFVSRFYVWSDATVKQRDQVLAFDRSAPGFQARVPEGPALVSKIRTFAGLKRTIVAFNMDVEGRPTYIQAQLRFTFPGREHLTSFVAFAVDADYLRRRYLPTLLTAKLRRWDAPTRFPPLTVVLLDSANRVVFPPDGTAPAGFIEQRRFPLVFFDQELARYMAPTPTEATPELWTLRTGYGNQTIPEIIAARERPQRTMMAVLAVVMGLGVFFVARAAAREVRLAELRSNFVASVSHDLKTPLALIQLFAETLELGRVKHPDRAQEYYRIINSEARKLTRLINDLLDFSRIEAGLRHYTVEPVDLGELTGRVLESLDSQFRHYHSSVKSRMAPDMPRVMVDPKAAEQAIENLLSNAMKYSPDHREILVEVDAADGFGRVRVTDHGVGIPARFQRKIFRKFYRIQTDADSGPQGTGLGLAIVDHVMRAHGGFVEVDSTPGHGSTFSLHFPLSVEAHGDATDPGDRGRAADVARSA